MNGDKTVDINKGINKNLLARTKSRWCQKRADRYNSHYKRKIPRTKRKCGELASSRRRDITLHIGTDQSESSNGIRSFYRQMMLPFFVVVVICWHGDFLHGLLVSKDFLKRGILNLCYLPTCHNLPIPLFLNVVGCELFYGNLQLSSLLITLYLTKPRGSQYIG